MELWSRKFLIVPDGHAAGCDVMLLLSHIKNKNKKKTTDLPKTALNVWHWSPSSLCQAWGSVIQRENLQHLFPNPVDPILPFVFLLFYLFIIKHYVCNCLKGIHYIRRHSRCLCRKAENGVWITLWSVFTQLSGAFILWWGTTTQTWTPFVSSRV